MSWNARIVHHIPGRLRLRIATAKRNAVLLEQIRQAIASLPRVERVKVNALTGSVLIEYLGESRALLEALRGAGLRLETARLQTASAPRGPGRNWRKFAGRSLLAAGIAGVLLPVIPGTPFLIAAAALLGADDPVVARGAEWLRRGPAVLRELRQVAG